MDLPFNWISTGPALPKRTMARSVNATSSLVPPANILVKTTLPAEHAVTQLESLAAINT